jgi:hypothetical protein
VSPSPCAQYDPKVTKEALQSLAYKENAVGRWEELHPEKKKKPKPAGGGGGGAGGMPDYANMKAPDGMDPVEWARLMGQVGVPSSPRRNAGSGCERRVDVRPEAARSAWPRA